MWSAVGEFLLLIAVVMAVPLAILALALPIAGLVKLLTAAVEAVARSGV